MAVTVRELVTRWGVKTDTKGIDKMNKAIKATKVAVLAIGVATVAAAAGLFGLAKSVADVGDNLAKTAKQLGLNVNALQELTFAAGIGGVAQAELVTGIRKFTRTVLEARRGTETYARVFRELGIDTATVNDTQLETVDLIEIIADRFKEMEGGLVKTALAQELFGRAGAKLIPFLDEGADGIAKLRKEFRDLGGVMSGELLKASEDFQDELLRVKTVLLGIKFIIGEDLVPAIVKGITAFKEFLLANRAIIKEGLLKFIGAVSFAVKGAFNVFQAFLRITEEVGSGLSSMGVGLLILTGLWLALGTAALIASAKMLLIPIAIAAAIAIIILIVEDLISFFKGENSLFGVLNEEFKKLPNLFKFPFFILTFEIRKVIIAMGTLIDLFNVLRGKLGIGDFLKRGLSNVKNLFAPGRLADADLVTTLGLQNFRPESVPTGNTSSSSKTTVGDINVTVVGGQTNAETGAAVAAGVEDGLDAVLRQAGRDTAPAVAQ